jgi:hypothetical protein
MFLRDGNISDHNGLSQARDLTNLPSEAWSDVQESASLVWQTWVNLFPNGTLWDPFGAALTLTLLIVLVVWLIKIRPG